MRWASRAAFLAHLASLGYQCGPAQRPDSGVGEGSPVSLPPLPDVAEAVPADTALPESIFSENTPQGGYSAGRPAAIPYAGACTHYFTRLRRESFVVPDPIFADATNEGLHDVLYCCYCAEVRYVNPRMMFRRLHDGTLIRLSGHDARS